MLYNATRIETYRRCVHHEDYNKRDRTNICHSSCHFKALFLKLRRVQLLEIYFYVVFSFFRRQIPDNYNSFHTVKSGCERSNMGEHQYSYINWSIMWLDSLRWLVNGSSGHSSLFIAWRHTSHETFRVSGYVSHEIVRSKVITVSWIQK